MEEDIVDIESFDKHKKCVFIIPNLKSHLYRTSKKILVTLICGICCIHLPTSPLKDPSIGEGLVRNVSCRGGSRGCNDGPEETIWCRRMF